MASVYTIAPDAPELRGSLDLACSGSIQQRQCTVACAGFGTAGKASLVMNVFLLLQLLFAGYFVSVDSITVVLRWLHYLSAFYYGFESLVINEISGLVFAFQVPYPCPPCMGYSLHSCPLELLLPVFSVRRWKGASWVRHYFSKALLG